MNALDLLYLPAAALTAPVWARKTRADWPARLGRAAPLLPRVPDVPRLMLHAVSVGEVNTLRTLVPLLATEGVEVVVSVGTDTGIGRARELFEAAGSPNGGHAPPVRVVRYPLDFSSAVRRFLDAVRPDAVGLVELEVWPNFVAECARRSIPVAVINGRLSPRSFRGYRRIRRFLAPTFARLTAAAVQSEEYAERFRAMGVAPDRVAVTDSMKWDSVAMPAEGAPPPAEALRLAEALGIDRSRPLIVAGSTGALAAPGSPRADSEERALHDACPPGAQLLCAPRKPERFAAAFAALGGPGRCVRRSAHTAPARPARRGADRFLLDTIGELRHAYALADLVVVGRSLGGGHGSDPIEPASLGKAVLIGPDHGDFQVAVNAFRAADAVRIVHPQDLARTLAELLNDPRERARLGSRARACIAAHRGATARHAALLRDLLFKTPTPNFPRPGRVLVTKA